MPCLSTVYGWKRSLTTTSLKKPLLLSSRWERVFTLYIIAWGGFPVIVSYWWSGQPVSKRHRINPFIVSNPKFVDFFCHNDCNVSLSPRSICFMLSHAQFQINLIYSLSHHLFSFKNYSVLMVCDCVIFFFSISGILC